MSANTVPETPPPEAVLIEQARTAIRPSLSVRAAAKRAKISEGRWRQIAKGYQAVTADTSVPVSAPAETLARMAFAVGVTTTQLRDAGRADAADELDLMASAASQPPTAPGQRRLQAADLTDAELMAELRRRALAQDAHGLAAREVPPDDDGAWS